MFVEDLVAGGRDGPRGRSFRCGSVRCLPRFPQHGRLLEVDHGHGNQVQLCQTRLAVELFDQGGIVGKPGSQPAHAEDERLSQLMRRGISGCELGEAEGVFGKQGVVGGRDALAADRPFRQPNQQNRARDDGPADDPMRSLAIERFEDAYAGRTGNDDEDRQANVDSNPHAPFPRDLAQPEPS